MSWEQSESDSTVVGLIGGRELSAKFDDYQGWGIDAGYRHFFNTEYKATPFVAFSVGFQRIQDITLDLSSATFNATDIPFYDDSWVAGWRLGTGFLYDINDTFGWQVTIDVSTWVCCRIDPASAPSASSASTTSATVGRCLSWRERM